MRDIGHAVLIEDELRLQLDPGALQLLCGNSFAGYATNFFEQQSFQAVECRAFSRRYRHRVEEGMLGWQHRTGDGRSDAALHERAIQTRLTLAGLRSETAPQVHAL